MTRRKRRKISGCIKLFGILSAPVALGMLISGAGGGFKHESPKISDVLAVKENEFRGESFEDKIHSVGYGYKEETEDSVPESENPLYAVAEDAGEKPYPQENEWTEGGNIIRTTYGTFSGTTYFDLSKAGQVNNKTELPNELMWEESLNPPDFKIEDTDKPQVLIYHTHTTETFEPYVREHFDDNFNYRTTDSTKNMIMVGDAICRQLEEKGIKSVHATEIHDYPSYNGSYARSRETIEAILEQYPSIKVALDIHRDAIQNDDGAYQPIANINGKEAAQIMIISCCDDGSGEMPEYMKNFHFASYLQQQLESEYAGLTRPLMFDYRKYNQDLTSGSLLIEVGSHGNTLEQVQYSGELIGNALGDALNSIKE